MPLPPAEQILWGTGLENVLDFDHPRVLDGGPRAWRRPGQMEQATRVRIPGAGFDAWWEKGDYLLAGRARWFGRSDWSNPVGLQAFIDWAAQGNAFRFVPDKTVPDFYVDNCFLEAPFDAPEPDIEQDGSQSIDLLIRNATVDFNNALRGIMFEYVPGASLTDPVAASFTRASAATRRGLPSTSMAAAIGASDLANVLRDRHYEGSLRTALLESSRVQFVTEPENFGAWSVNGTPTLTGGQSDPFGGTAAYLIEDNDGAAVERVLIAVTFTSDGTKPLALFIKQGTASSITGFLGLWDSTDTVWRHKLNLSWSAAGVPTVTTGVGAGTIYPVEDWGGGWWRVLFTASGVVAANTNLIFILSDLTTFTGSLYVFGCNAWNDGVPTSYQGPALTTKNRDDFTSSFLYVPQPMFVYAKFVERGTATSGATNKGILHIGSPGVGSRVFDLNNPGGSQAYRVTHGDATLGFSEAQLGSVPAWGNVVELMGILHADGHVTIRQSINGGAETFATTATTKALTAAWSAQELRFNQRDTNSIGWAAYARAKIGCLTFGGITRDTIAKALLA